jgi:hypothetical protein
MIGQKVIAIMTDPLEGNKVAPPLVMGKEYEIKEVITCGCGKEHYDVGLASEYDFITCHSCREDLKRGDDIHWCHPSRFKPST